MLSVMIHQDDARVLYISDEGMLVKRCLDDCVLDYQGLMLMSDVRHI